MLGPPPQHGHPPAHPHAPHGHTPLPFYCAHTCHPRMIRRQPTTSDVQGHTPLHHAARNNHPAVLERLVEKGADVNAKDQVHAKVPTSFGCLRMCRASPRVPLPPQRHNLRPMFARLTSGALLHTLFSAYSPPRYYKIKFILSSRSSPCPSYSSPTAPMFPPLCALNALRRLAATPKPIPAPHIHQHTPTAAPCALALSLTAILSRRRH